MFRSQDGKREGWLGENIKPFQLISDYSCD